MGSSSVVAPTTELSLAGWADAVVATGADLETYRASFHRMESISRCESRLMGESEDRLDSAPVVAFSVVLGLAKGAALTVRHEHGVITLQLLLAKSSPCLSSFSLPSLVSSFEMSLLGRFLSGLQVALSGSGASVEL